MCRQLRGKLIWQLHAMAICPMTCFYMQGGNATLHNQERQTAWLGRLRPPVHWQLVSAGDSWRCC